MKPNLPSVAAMSPAALLTILLLTYVARADPNPPHDAPAHTDGAAPPPRAPFAWAVCESYKALGPLPLSGVGADPMAALPGRGSFDEMLALASFPSESAVGGAASWRPAVYNASDGVVVLPFPEADGEYEAWAAGEFEVAGTAKGSVVRCSSPAYFRRAGKGEDGSTTRCGADTYEDGRGLCPIKLRKGKYQVFVHVSGDRNETAFLCNFFKDARGLDPPTLLPLNDTIVPDFVVEKSAGGSRVARLAGAHCAVSVMNSDTEEWAVMGKAELRGAPHGLYLAPPPQSSSEEGLPRIAPRQILQLRLDMDVDAGFVELKSVNGSYPTSVSFSVAVSYQLGSDKRHETVFQLEFDVAEWGKSRSYRFTYIDVDGSVQAAAVLPPKFPCIGAAAGRNRCPTILSTHGAGVDALASAWTESYRTQNQSWVLLPTGRRKYGMFYRRRALCCLPRKSPEFVGFLTARSCDLFLFVQLPTDRIELGGSPVEIGNHEHSSSRRRAPWCSAR